MADDIRNCGDLDERLAPFVDGEATSVEHAAVAAHLAACPPCRKGAEAERSARDLVREHRDALCPHASAALRDRCAHLRQDFIAQTGGPSLLRKWAPLSLAATLVLAIAGVFVFGLTNRVEALAASLTMDHVKCFKVGGAAARANSSAAAQKWAQDYGWPVSIPADMPAEQLRLVDVRRCFSTDGRAAHMMYRWRGAALSLFVLPANTRYEQVVKNMGHQAVIWCANQRTYAVVADGQSPHELTRVVEYLKANAK